MTHTAWATGMRFTFLRLLGCLFARLWDTQMRNRDCGGPTSPPWFRKGSFSGNLSCRFSSTNDLRAALSELSNAGDRSRWWGELSQPISPKPATSLVLLDWLILPFPPVSLLSLLHLSLPSVPLSPSPFFLSASFGVLFSFWVFSPVPKYNWSIHFTTVLTSL